MKKIATLNLLVSLTSKGIAFLLAIYVARILTPMQFGYYIYFMLIASYLPFLQLGSVHGLIYDYPKIKADNENEASNYYSDVTFFSLTIQIAVGLPLFFFDFGVGTTSMVLIYLNLIVDKYLENENIHYTTNLEFKKMVFIKAIREVGVPLLRLIVAFYTRDLATILVSAIYVNLFTAIVIFILFKRHPALPRKNFKMNIERVYKLGFPIFVLYAFELLLKSLDRIFVAHSYPKEILASYGFAGNLAQALPLLALSTLVPYTQTLFNHIAQKKWSEIPTFISHVENKLRKYLILAFLLSLIAYPLITKYFIRKYFDSYASFILLTFGNVLLSDSIMRTQLIISSEESPSLIKTYLSIIVPIALLYLAISIFNFNILNYSIVMAVALVVFRYFVNRISKIIILKKIGTNEWPK